MRPCLLTQALRGGAVQWYHSYQDQRVAVFGNVDEVER